MSKINQRKIFVVFERPPKPELKKDYIYACLIPDPDRNWVNLNVISSEAFQYPSTSRPIETEGYFEVNYNLFGLQNESWFRHYENIMSFLESKNNGIIKDPKPNKN